MGVVARNRRSARRYRRRRRRQRASYFYCAPSAGLAYLQIERCASTTFKNLILRIEGIDPEGHTPADIRPQTGTWVHARRDLFDRYARGRLPSRYFAFTFVRCPYDRTVSFYQSKLRRWDDERMFRHMGTRFHSGMSFRRMVERLVTVPHRWLDAHIAPQYRSLIGPDGRPFPGFIGRLEHVRRDWETLQRCAGFDVPLDHLGYVSPSRADDFFDDETADLVYDYFRRDFELLGYPRRRFGPRRSDA